MTSPEILCNRLLDAIKHKLPKDANMANILTDILFIGKEAAYRRLRGEVSFTLYEAALIARKFQISLDSIINLAPFENLIFELKPQRFYNLRDIDYKMLEEYIDVLKFSKTDPKAEQVFTSNVFPQFPSHKHYLLTKYSSFRWMYLNEKADAIKSFHEMEFPDRLYKLCRDCVNETMNIANTSYIWDSTIFQSIVKEIKYFSNIELINAQDVLLLKNELEELLNFIERITAIGCFENGNKIQIYISDITSDTGYAYLDTEYLHLSMINAFALNYLVALDKRTLDKIKERVQSLKRVSTLISESGEEQRLRFLRAQREIVSTL